MLSRRGECQISSFSGFQFPAPVRRGENLPPTRRTRRRRHRRSVAGNSSGARARLSTRGQECHALGRFGVSPARTPSDPPPSARRDSGVASVKVRLHKRHNTLSTIKISTINAQFNDHYARKGSVPGRYRPPRKGADKITLKILQVCA